jgi:hypothetical protein
MRGIAVLLVAGLFGAGPATACSMAPGYKVPTNLELVAAGETIVIAVIESDQKSADAQLGSLIARPMTLLKGSVLPEAVVIEDAILAEDARTAHMVVASEPRELRAANPGALIGACVRYIFTKGMKVVLFLKRDQAGGLVPYRSAFSRDAEDVADENALWVKAIREYVPISLAPPAARKALLCARMTALRAEASDPDAQAIADDMAVEIRRKRLPPFD